MKSFQEDAKALFEQYNPLDLLVYEYASNLFQTRLTEMEQQQVNSSQSLTLLYNNLSNSLTNADNPSRAMASSVYTRAVESSAEDPLNVFKMVELVSSYSYL